MAPASITGQPTGAVAGVPAPGDLDAAAGFMRRARASRAWLATLALAVLWALFGPWTPDLAAQAHRVALFASQGFTVWDNSWYGGHHVPAYSLTFPALGAEMGMRTTGVCAAIASAALFATLVPRARGAQLAIWWFAIGCVGDLVVGRLTYALGIAAGLAAIAALTYGHRRLAVGLAIACAATSPVAGLFLALGCAAIAVADRRRDALAIVVAVGCVVLGLGHAFPEGGTQPFAVDEFVVTLAITLAALALLPSTHGRLRIAAALYAVALVVTFLIASPMGSNVTRLGATFTAPIMLAVGVGGSRRRRVGFCVVVAAAGCWQWHDPLAQARRGDDDPSVRASYYAPVLGWLARHGASTGRVEVPFTSGHWEGVYVARHFALARGWERQLDRELNPLFYAKPLSAADYDRWLRTHAVRYVAVPDVAMDRAGVDEAALIARRPAFLREAWHSRHWHVFAVRDPLPLAVGAARVVRLSATTVSLAAQRLGAVVLRVHWTPYWRVVHGHACVRRRGTWTALDVSAPGPVLLAARFSAEAMFAGPPRCPDPVGPQAR